MAPENFASSGIVYYDAAECGYNIMSGAEWMRRDREDWLRRRMPTRLVLEIAENELAATERLNAIIRYKLAESRRVAPIPA